MAYFKRLKADLAAAASGGIITPEQADEVWRKAYDSRMLAGFKAVHFIAAAAGLFIALGVILVTAHNWDKIGDMAKMGAFLLIAAGVAEAAVRLDEKPAAVPLETLWFFMPVLGIGLYAQIFHLSGDPVRPYLAWAVLSAPLALLSRRPLAGYLAAILLFCVLYTGTLASGSMMALVTNYTVPAQPVWHWALAAAVAAGGVLLYPGRKTGMPLGAAAVWAFLMLTLDTALRLRSEALILLAGMSLAVLWLAWGPAPEGRRTGMSVNMWLAAVYLTTFFWHHEGRWYYDGRGDSPVGTAITLSLFAGALATAALRPQRLLPGGRSADLVSRGLLAASMLCAFLLFGNGPAMVKAVAAVANFILIAYGAGCIVGGSEEADEKAINRGIAVITLTAVTRFVDIFGSLLASGEAFILTGAAFAALAYFINKGRKALIEAARK